MAANGKKTLYVSDMDGTLLSSDSRVSAESARIISELSAEGALITVATARTPATVVPLLADTRIAAEAIVMTGAARWDFRRGCFAHTHRIAAESTRRIIEICASRGAHPFVYIEAPDGRTMDVYHAAAAMNRAEESFYLERRHLKLKRFHLCKPVPADALERTLLMFAMGPRENIEEIAELIRMSSDCNVSCYPDIFNENIGNLEIQAPGISKASAIRSLAAELGVERSVVFGDNLNDLPMFAIADEAVAVANAEPEVKAAATIIIGPNYTDAVARFIASDFRNARCS